MRNEVYIDLKGNKIKGQKFVNYLQVAIKLNLFGQKNSWYITQNKLSLVKKIFQRKN